MPFGALAIGSHLLSVIFLSPFLQKTRAVGKDYPAPFPGVCAGWAGGGGAMARHGAQWRVVARGHLVHLHHAAHSTAHHTQHRCSTDGRQAPALLVLPCVPGAVGHLVALPLGLSLCGASLSPRAGSWGDRRARSPGCSSTAVNTPFEIPIVCAALGDGLRGAARGDRIAPRPSVRGDGAARGQARPALQKFCKSFCGVGLGLMRSWFRAAPVPGQIIRATAH